MKNKLRDEGMFFYYHNLEGKRDVVATLTLAQSTPGGCVIMASVCAIWPPFMGNALIQIKNVVPDNGKVFIRFGAAWHERLRFRVSVFGYTWAASA
jgi:hypothetical protein